MTDIFNWQVSWDYCYLSPSKLAVYGFVDGFEIHELFFEPPGTPSNQFKMDGLIKKPFPICKDLVHHPIDSQPF